MPKRPPSPIRSVPFRGGAITSVEKTLIPSGSYSMVQNMRAPSTGKRGGLKTRPGQRKLHTTADSTNEVLSLYQFKKERVTETHTFAQMSDGDVLEATNQPPTVTTGLFGSEVFDGSASQMPASWGNIDDKMIHSNGVDQHQIYGGTLSYVEKFIVYRGTDPGTAVFEYIPTEGEDYSDEVTDGLTTTVAVLDSLSTAAAFDCLYIRTPVPAKSFTFTVGKANGNASVPTINYWKNTSVWYAVSGQGDTTDSGGATLGVTGTMSFTMPTDIIPKYLYGTSGWWYQITFSAALDSEVEISKVTYATDWQDIVNVWDGIPVDAVEVQTEGTSTYAVNSSGAVDLDGFGAGKKIMISCSDPIEGIYIDVGSTPNATGTTITSLKYWTGDAMANVGTVVGETLFDWTSGMSSSGWIVFPRQTARPFEFNHSKYYAYWYELIFDTQISADVNVAIQVQPYYKISELGNGYTNCVWKDRVMYSFDRYGEYLYASRSNAPMVLNGSDYGILRAGDGRPTKIVAQRKFHNELVVFQEEKGVEGGSVTLFEGYSPTTFGKLVLSSSIGTFSNKTVAVVDGVLTSTSTDEEIKTLVFFLSRYGVCVTDGKTISIISDDIQNYFDPTKSECIRRGYEQKMWLEHDRAFNVIRIGLVSGSSATLPNIVPVFDLADKVWYFDDLAQELSCLVNVEADSGDIPIIQIAGGIDDGTVYQSNYGTNDAGTAIDAYATMEIDGEGQVINVREMILRLKGSEGGCTITPYIDEVAQTAKVIS